MSDLDKYKSLLDNWNVHYKHIYTEDDRKNDNRDWDIPDVDKRDDIHSYVRLIVSSEKVEGYAEFYSDACFDENGKFLKFIIAE